MTSLITTNQPMSSKLLIIGLRGVKLLVSHAGHTAWLKRYQYSWDLISDYLSETTSGEAQQYINSILDAAHTFISGFNHHSCSYTKSIIDRKSSQYIPAQCLLQTKSHNCTPTPPAPRRLLWNQAQHRLPI